MGNKYAHAESVKYTYLREFYPKKELSKIFKQKEQAGSSSIFFIFLWVWGPHHIVLSAYT